MIFIVLLVIVFGVLYSIHHSLWAKHDERLGELVIESLTNDPDSWKIDHYYAIRGNFMMWIANRPYKDLEIWNDIRVGNFWQRRKIRKLLDRLRAEDALYALEGKDTLERLMNENRISEQRPRDASGW